MDEPKKRAALMTAAPRSNLRPMNAGEIVDLPRIRMGIAMNIWTAR